MSVSDLLLLHGTWCCSFMHIDSHVVLFCSVLNNRPCHHEVNSLHKTRVVRVVSSLKEPWFSFNQRRLVDLEMCDCTLVVTKTNNQVKITWYGKQYNQLDRAMAE